MRNEKNLKDRLMSSMSSEKINIDNRFDNADKILFKNESVRKSYIEDKTQNYTFSFPIETIKTIELIIDKSARQGIILNRSEVIRLAVDNFYSNNDKDFLKLIQNVKRLKKGRSK